MDHSRMNNIKKNKNDRFERSHDDDELRAVEIKTKKKYMEAPVEILREFNMSGNEKKFEDHFRSQISRQSQTSSKDQCQHQADCLF